MTARGIAAARPGEISRERRMRQMVLRTMAANGLDPTASMKRIRRAHELADRLLDREDQQDAIARGEKVRPASVARVQRQIDKLTASFDRMLSWDQMRINWRIAEDARTSARSVTPRTSDADQRPTSRARPRVAGAETPRVLRSLPPPAAVGRPDATADQQERTDK